MYNTYKTKQLWKFTNHLQILWLELSLYISINHNLGVQYVKFFIRKDLFLHSLLIESKKKKERNNTEYAYYFESRFNITKWNFIIFQ